MKNKPLLIDEFVAKGPKQKGPYGVESVPVRLFNAISNARFSANRFLFTPDASRYVGDFAIDCGDIIIENRQFALPPYENCYVEVDSMEFYTEARKRKLSGIFDTLKPDDRVAYLNIGNSVYTFMSQGGHIGVAYWKYVIAPPGEGAPAGDVIFDLDEVERGFERDIWKIFQRRISQEDFNSQDGFRLWHYLTSTFPMGDEKLFKTAWPITREVQMHWLVPENHEIRTNGPLQIGFMKAFNGDLRNYWALMLWLNQPCRTKFFGVPSGRRIIKGKLTPYMKYNTVEINLGRCKTVRKAFIIDGERASPVGHTVRSHWAHRGGYRRCISDEGHKWPMESNESGSFVCENCGLQRWRVKEHNRGDAGKGWMNKDYEVAA